jgi:hypothetical protein
MRLLALKGLLQIEHMDIPEWQHTPGADQVALPLWPSSPVLRISRLLADASAIGQFFSEILPLFGRITGNPEVILDRLKSRRFTNCR